MKPPWPRRPLGVMAAFAALATLPAFVPGWAHFQFDWRAGREIFEFGPRAAAQPEPEAAIDPVRPRAAARHDPRKIADPRSAMTPFYETLLRTERGEPGAITRILHYGDSPVTADLIVADVRALLVERFGDAGHGTHLIARPWAWYGHAGVGLQAGGWHAEAATQRGERDGWYGLGGVSFTGATGAWSRFRMRGTESTKIRVSYVEQPGGGQFAVLAGGTETGVVDTAAAEVRTASASFDLAAGTREIELRVLRGSVRLFQAELLRNGPGIVYDSIGLNGAYTGVLARHMDARHWTEQLRLARPSLVILNYGSNESEYAPYIDSQYESDLRETVRRVRAALPEAAILIMSPMDRGVRDASGAIATLPAIPRLVALQARLAEETGCAFFNTFEAMGGAGTMGRWYSAQPRLVSADFLHPLPAGGRIVGTLLYNALMDGYNAYKLRLLRQRAAAEKKAEAASK